MNKPRPAFFRGPMWLNHALAKGAPFAAMLLLIGGVFAAEVQDFMPDHLVTYKTASDFELFRPKTKDLSIYQRTSDLTVKFLTSLGYIQ